MPGNCFILNPFNTSDAGISFNSPRCGNFVYIETISTPDNAKISNNPLLNPTTALIFVHK